MVAAFFQDKPNTARQRNPILLGGHVNIDVDIFSRCIEA